MQSALVTLGGSLLTVGGGLFAAIVAVNQNRWAASPWFWVGIVLAAIGLAFLVVAHRREGPSERVIERAATKALRGQKLSRKERRVLVGREPKVFDPTAVQGPRPGWKATCQYVGDSVFGRGVLLGINSAGDSESAANLRCRITDPSKRVREFTPDQFGLDKSPRASLTKHYPGEFGDPTAPFLEGEYHVEWLGEIGDWPGGIDMFLAETTFKVNNRGQIYCAPRSAPEPVTHQKVTHLSTFIAPTIPGWTAAWKTVRAAEGVGEALQLSIEAGEETDPEQLRCVVVGPGDDGPRHIWEDPNAKFRTDPRDTGGCPEFPQDFNPKDLDWPLPAGDYQVIWRAIREQEDGSVRALLIASHRLHVTPDGVVADA